MERIIDFDYRKLEAEQLYYDLIDDIKMLKNQDRLDYTKLNLYVGKENPDDSFSEVPYSKGYALLHYLEQTVLESENDFQKILKKYVIKYKYSSVIYTDFIEVFMSEIEELYKEDKEKLERVKSMLKWEEWVNEVDIPKLIVNDYSNKYSDEYKKEFEDLKKNKSFNIDFVETFTKKWTSVQREGFLVMIKFDESVVDDNIIDYIRNTLDLKNKEKYPINTRFRWLQIELNRNSTVGYEVELSDFLDEIGITSIVRELYQKWMEFNKIEAYEEFKKHLDVYNSNTVRLIEQDFNN